MQAPQRGVAAALLRHAESRGAPSTRARPRPRPRQPLTRIYISLKGYLFHDLCHQYYIYLSDLQNSLRFNKIYKAVGNEVFNTNGVSASLRGAALPAHSHVVNVYKIERDCCFVVFENMQPCSGQRNKPCGCVPGPEDRRRQAVAG